MIWKWKNGKMKKLLISIMSLLLLVACNNSKVSSVEGVDTIESEDYPQTQLDMNLLSNEDLEAYEDSVEAEFLKLVSALPQYKAEFEKEKAAWLEKWYLMLMKQYTQHSQFPNPADISNPFWHLQSDGFWHLHHKTAVADGSTPTKRWLKEHVDFAYFDDDLWILLQNKVWRMKLRDYIVEHKLSDDHWLGKTAAESLWAIAALLMVA